MLALVGGGAVVYLEDPFGWLPSESDSVRGHGSVEAGRLLVNGEDRIEFVLSEPELSGEAIEELGSLASAGILIGTPMDITATGGLDGTVVQLTKTFAVALPADATSTLGYWDDEGQAWIPVPSVVSDDRRSVTATVDHLSFWNDFTAAAGDAGEQFVKGLKDSGQAVKDGFDDVIRGAGEVLNGAAETVYYVAGSAFDARVDSPSCNSATPEWVTRHAPDLAYAPNDVVHWCAGRDKDDPSVLEVKARVNRGYAMPYAVGSEPQWRYNSALKPGAVQAGIDALTGLDQVLANSVLQILEGGDLALGAGEVSFGFSEEAVNQVGDAPLVELRMPSPTSFVFSILSRALVQTGLEVSDAAATSAIALASCGINVAQISDAPAGLRAVSDCFSSARLAITQSLAVYMLDAYKLSPKQAGKRAAQFTGRLNMLAALGGVGLQVASYATDAANVHDLLKFRAVTNTPPSTDSKITLGVQVVPDGATVFEEMIGWGEIRPTRLAWSGGGAGSVLEDIVWETWGGDTADGSGWVLDEAGNRRPIVVEAFDLGQCLGELRYRQFRWAMPDNPADVLTTGSTQGVC